MEQSTIGKLDKENLKKIGVGALIALGGALITYAADVVQIINFGEYTPFVVATVGILINIVRKVLTDYSKKYPTPTIDSV